MGVMSKRKPSLSRREEARKHIIKADTLVHFMDAQKSGDYPHKRQEYESIIRDVVKILQPVYGSENLIFDDLKEGTNIGLNTALGRLGLGDMPFLDWGEVDDAELVAIDRMNEMLQSYVRKIHPESAWQQEALLDLIHNGEIEVELTVAGGEPNV